MSLSASRDHASLPWKLNTTRAFGSDPFAIAFFATPRGRVTFTSFHVSLWFVDGSEPRYVSASVFVRSRSRLPTKTNVKPDASANLSL